MGRVAHVMASPMRRAIETALKALAPLSSEGAKNARFSDVAASRI